jgi:hypothetical protein
LYAWIADVHVPMLWAFIFGVGLGGFAGEICVRAAFALRRDQSLGRIAGSLGMFAGAAILMLGTINAAHAPGFASVGFLLGGGLFVLHRLETAWRLGFNRSLAHAGQHLFDAGGLVHAFHNADEPVREGETVAEIAPAVSLPADAEVTIDRRIVSLLADAEVTIDRPAAEQPPVYRLEEMIAAMTPENTVPGEIDTGPARGNEFPNETASLVGEDSGEIVKTSKVTMRLAFEKDTHFVVITSNDLTNSQLDKPDGLFKLIQKTPGVSFVKAKNLGNGRKQLTVKVEGFLPDVVSALEAIVMNDKRFQ